MYKIWNILKKGRWLRVIILLVLQVLSSVHQWLHLSQTNYSYPTKALYSKISWKLLKARKLKKLEKGPFFIYGWKSWKILFLISGGWKSWISLVFISLLLLLGKLSVKCQVHLIKFLFINIIPWKTSGQPKKILVIFWIEVLFNHEELSTLVKCLIEWILW